MTIGHDTADPTTGPLDLPGVWALSPRFELAGSLRRHLGRVLGGLSLPAVVACFDNWSARIALDAAALAPKTVGVAVVESTDELVARAERRSVTLLDDGSDGVAAAAVVIAPRLGTTVGDVETQLGSVCARCAPDGTVVWSHCLRADVCIETARKALATAGFTEVETETVGIQPGFPGWFVASASRGRWPAGSDPL